MIVGRTADGNCKGLIGRFRCLIKILCRRYGHLAVRNCADSEIIGVAVRRRTVACAGWERRKRDLRGCAVGSPQIRRSGLAARVFDFVDLNGRTGIGVLRKGIVAVRKRDGHGGGLRAARRIIRHFRRRGIVGAKGQRRVIECYRADRDVFVILGIIPRGQRRARDGQRDAGVVIARIGGELRSALSRPWSRLVYGSCNIRFRLP